MHIGNKNKKITIRIQTEYYYNLYSIFEKYKAGCPNLTFSDFIRNILLSICSTNIEHENKEEHK